MPVELPPEVRTARDDVARMVTERNQVLRDAARTGAVDHARLTEIDRGIGGRLDTILALIDPCDASEVEPLVLLPVRLETRFDTSGPAAVLKVRIYPDEIHVDDLARGLTADEVAAGRAWWTSAWTDPVADGTWTDFVAAVGADRAGWVAHVTTPTNLGERGPATTPTFPEPQERGPRNVVARALPDRFVVLAIQGGQVSRAVGRAVPPDLSLSPIPLEGDSPTRVPDALTLPPGSEWLVDFDRAVEVGMAVTVALVGGAAPIQRVIALGTRASTTPSAAADELEDLLAGHRFGAGLGLLAQGTATNNADSARSPYHARIDPQAPALTPAAPQPGSDATIAAETLGLDPGVLTGLVGGGTGEQGIAQLINTVLWAPGWGEYLSRLDDQNVPGLEDAQRESARRLFRDHVRGRGNVPAVHVGAQPYGVLPVSNIHTWVPEVGETTAGIAQVVRLLLGRWGIAADRKVPVIRPGRAGLDETFLDVLGSSPVMQGLRVRPLLSDDVADSVIASLGLDRGGYAAELMSITAIFAGLLGTHASKAVIGSLHEDDRPLPLPLSSARDPEFIDALLQTPSRTLAIDSVLQALLFLAWNSSELDVAKAAPASVLPTLLELVDFDPQLKLRATALIARADTAPPEELHDVVAELRAVGVAVGGSSMLREYQPAAQIQTSLAEVALSAPVSAEARAVGASALGGWLLAMGYRNEVRLAMQALVATDVDARRLAVAEALDCSSHRLDAWTTGVVADRRARQVARARAAGTTRGLTIGAYGVVEDLRPQAGPKLDGWIHAPSMRHAISAGMLRSSHLSHLPAGGGDNGPFAIDLSSRRMQSAAHVIEGVRQGQQLGALIGYQIERGLAAVRLARLQLSLRTIAPLVARRLHDADGADSQQAQEAIAANNVVDGVRLLKLHPAGDPALRRALDAPPTNAYLDPGDWQPLTDGEWAAVTAILVAAADAIDAVADVMLSESVLQFAGGNPHRAAAAMDAMSTGASPSDTIDVLEAQDSGERLNHRVLAIVGANVPPSTWNQLRPRAQLEPAIEAWAAAHLGDPANVVVADIGARRVTLAEAGFAALDLVAAADLLALERTLRMSIPDLAGATLAVTRDPAWPAELRALGQVVGLATTLRSIVAGANALLPLDLVRPGMAVTRDLAAAIAELTSRVTGMASAIDATVGALAATVASIPDDGIVADDATATALTQAVQSLEPFGIPLEPIVDLPLDVSWIRGAWHTAQARSLNAQAALGRLAAVGADPRLALDTAQDVAAAVFGDGFLVVPVLAPGATNDDFVDGVTAPAFPAPPPGAVRRFVRDVSTVRQQVTRFSEALLLGGALGHPRPLAVVQLSERDAAGPVAGTTRWLAGPLPAEGPWPPSPVAHVVVDQVGTVDAGASLAGMVVDSWVEDLPAQVGPKADPNDPRPGRARTGLAIRCNSASARPPQAVLCAVSPDGERWTTDSLRGVVEHTLELARARLVTLERFNGEGLALPALYVRSSSLQGEQHLYFKNLAEAATAYLPMPFVKELKP